MKYLVIIDKKFPLHYQDKIIYFDTKEEAENLINGCYLVLNKKNMEFKQIEYSKVNNTKYINYKDVHIM